MIIFCHLLNDNSGSPRVLKQLIERLKADEVVRLYVGSQGRGVLDSCGTKIYRYWYRRTTFKIGTLFTLFFSQTALFSKLFWDRTIPKDAVIYVNTLLPFGAAIYGKLTGRKVIYHVHEISISPAPLKALLTTVTRMTSSINIYVSDAHIEALPISGVPSQRVYNSLEESFIESALSVRYSPRHEGYFNVLLIASLRDYKGIPEFLKLAKDALDQDYIRFQLVVNDDQKAIDRYFAGEELPSNLLVHPRTAETKKFYRQSNLVLNLSRVDQWIETFGLTVLEAMTFGIPVIIPPLGGPAELVTDGIQGFHVNSYDQKLLLEKILLLYRDREMCERMSVACRTRAADFSPAAFAENVVSIINQIRNTANEKHH
jgi:glycosyltransferase involved in cell wall biosynthesis